MTTLSSKNVVIIGAITLLSGCSTTISQGTPSLIPTTPVMMTSSSEPTELESAKIKEMKPMMTTDESVLTTEQQAAPVYQKYTPELYASLKGKKPFVLFFHAPWCPTCKRMEQEINASLTSFPQGTIILKTDYDTETALKRTWGVQLQSTIVVLDAKGESIFKAVDPGITKMKEMITKSL